LFDRCGAKRIAGEQDTMAIGGELRRKLANGRRFADPFTPTTRITNGLLPGSISSGRA